jgi:hypothetical protein
MLDQVLNWFNREFTSKLLAVGESDLLEVILAGVIAKLQLNSGTSIRH